MDKETGSGVDERVKDKLMQGHPFDEDELWDRRCKECKEFGDSFKGNNNKLQCPE